MTTIKQKHSNNRAKNRNRRVSALNDRAQQFIDRLSSKPGYVKTDINEAKSGNFALLKDKPTKTKIHTWQNGQNKFSQNYENFK